VFKPFVYAAAFNNAVDGAQPVVTPATTVDDEPTVFEFDGQEYTPNNYGERFMGKVTVRQALTNSLNVATVKVAEMVGYGRVVQIARQMGLSANIRPTPAVALGAYELTPLEVAGAYTAFATMGTRAEPYYIKSVVSASGNSLEKYGPTTKLALDPRVTYLVDSILKDVLNKGTGAQVRAKGFTLPAAGKTGTSRDGWFAGFTSNLVCVIWIGFDDNHDLGLAGGATAAPIWADFMIHATALPGYRDVRELDKPEGVDSVIIDADTLEVATPNCPVTREEVYVSGSGPTQFCELHGGHNPLNAAGSFLSHIFGGGSSNPPPPNTNVSPNGQVDKNGAPVAGQPGGQTVDPAKTQEKKKALYRSFLVSLGTRRRKTRRSPTRAKEIRHDQEFLGDSGSDLPRSCFLAFVVSPGKVRSGCKCFDLHGRANACFFRPGRRGDGAFAPGAQGIQRGRGYFLSPRRNQPEKSACTGMSWESRTTIRPSWTRR